LTNSTVLPRLRIGVDLGGTKIEAIALDPAGGVLVRPRMPTPAGDAAATVDAIVALVKRIEAQLGETGTVGVATPGAVSPATGKLRNSNSTCLNGLPLQGLLEDRLERPVRLANDANCFALSEATDGAGAGARVVFGVILGTGVGGGIVVDGRPVVGPHGIAGEWGHNPLPWPEDSERPGPACYCGRRGCIETFLSGPGLAADYAQAGGTGLTAEAIAAAAEAGDPAATAALDRYIDRLARSSATVVNVLDPDVVVLGGGLSNIAALYDTAPRRWNGFVFSDLIATRLISALHGDSSGVRGAAWLWNHA